VALERWRNQQAFNALALEQSNAAHRAEDERRRRQAVGHHRARRDHGSTGEQLRVRPCPAVDDVERTVVAEAALVIAGGTDRDT
jgi:hypothetical protein